MCIRDRGEPGHQNVGYLVTPQPLGAGTYVLCELSAPAGYVKSKPVAIEIYSDEVAYYLNGDRDSRVAAAIYETPVTVSYTHLDVYKRQDDGCTGNCRASGRDNGRDEDNTDEALFFD